MTTSPTCFSVPGAAQYLGVSTSWLNKTRCTGGGPNYRKLGLRRVCYLQTDLDDFLSKSLRKSTSDMGVAA